MDSLSDCYSCEHCGEVLGDIVTIRENGTISSHFCFRSGENVTVDEKDKVIRRSGGTSLTSSQASSDSWNDNAVQLLIYHFKEQKEKFESANYSKKRVWEIISQELSNYGINKSGVKCDEKWRNLRKTYEKVKMERGKTGNARVSWKYYDELHDIYFKDPHFTPLATASTSGPFKRKLADESNKENVPCAKKKKNKVSFSAAEVDERRQKRHDEKMAFKREVFEWMKNTFKSTD